MRPSSGGSHRLSASRSAQPRIVLREIRVAQVIDRVNNMSTIWLDRRSSAAVPQPQVRSDHAGEYHRLFSFFNNASEEPRYRLGRIPPGWAGDPAGDERLRAKTELVSDSRPHAEAGASFRAPTPTALKCGELSSRLPPISRLPCYGAGVKSAGMPPPKPRQGACGLGRPHEEGVGAWRPPGSRSLSATSTGGETLQRLDDGSLIGGAVPDTSPTR
jgi:hypothetical protein